MLRIIIYTVKYFCEFKLTCTGDNDNDSKVNTLVLLSRSTEKKLLYICVCSNLIHSLMRSSSTSTKYWSLSTR